MRILVLGGDGYLGWPAAMHFSERGHDVLAVDSYLKRRLARDLGSESLIPCPDLDGRVKAWMEMTGKDIATRIGDVADYGFLATVFREFRPEAVIHYAEQPSAPYSMVNRDAAALTLTNNLLTTLNLAYAVKEHAPDCHIIKLGTMGEYGTPNIDIEEGWLEINHKGRKDKFLFPRQASSLYHTTKIQDTDMLWFYVRTWGLRVTDLMQGPVYGILTDEAGRDERLLPSFHYDEIFGTVVNRFIVQAASGHPLTVYGKGNQVRGYLNLMDTVACVNLAVETPARRGELRVFNQITETFSVYEIAVKVKKVSESLGMSASIETVTNPRVEKEQHYYNPQYSGLANLGLKPHFMTTDVLVGMFEKIRRYRDRINRGLIFRGVSWR